MTHFLPIFDVHPPPGTDNTAGSEFVVSRVQVPVSVVGNEPVAVHLINSFGLSTAAILVTVCDAVAVTRNGTVISG